MARGLTAPSVSTVSRPVGAGCCAAPGRSVPHRRHCPRSWCSRPWRTASATSWSVMPKSRSMPGTTLTEPTPRGRCRSITSELRKSSSPTVSGSVSRQPSLIKGKGQAVDLQRAAVALVDAGPQLRSKGIAGKGQISARRGGRGWLGRNSAWCTCHNGRQQGRSARCACADSNLERGLQLAAHRLALDAHVVRQAVDVGRVVLACDQRLQGSARQAAVMPKPSAVMKLRGTVFSTLATAASGTASIFQR